MKALLYHFKCWRNTLPFSLFAVSISAVLNTSFGHCLGTRVLESPITDSTNVGLYCFLFSSAVTFLLPLINLFIHSVADFKIRFVVYFICFCNISLYVIFKILKRYIYTMKGLELNLAFIFKMEGYIVKTCLTSVWNAILFDSIMSWYKIATHRLI